MIRRTSLSRNTLAKFFFIFLFGVTIMWTWTSDWCDDPFSDSLFCDNYDESDYIRRAASRNANALQSSDCPRRLLVARAVPYSSGNLGNHVMEYASAWALGKKHNMSVVMSGDITSAMEAVFERVSLPSEDAFVQALLREDMGCARRVRWCLRDAPEAESAAEVENVIRQQEAQDSGGKVTVALRSNIVLVDEVVGALEQLRPEFRLERSLEAQVQKVLHDAALSSGLLARPEDEIVYVGIHVRRNDSLGVMRNIFDEEETDDEIGVEYFIRAMDFILYLEELIQGDASRVLFLVVSNDQRWCREKLIPKLTAHVRSTIPRRERIEKDAGGDESAISMAVLWAGSDDHNHDFALLASCNHSIITYGTFGTAAALLAGGRTVVYDISAGNGDKKNGAMSFADQLTDWTIMH